MEHRSPCLLSTRPGPRACGLLPSVASRGVSRQDPQIRDERRWATNRKLGSFRNIRGRREACGYEERSWALELGIQWLHAAHCDSPLNRAQSRVCLRFHVFLTRRAAPNPAFSARDQRVIIAWGGLPRGRNTCRTRAKDMASRRQSRAKHLAIRSCSGQTERPGSGIGTTTDSGKTRAELAMKEQNSLSVEREAVALMPCSWVRPR
jgi:hypothetical protein